MVHNVHQPLLDYKPGDDVPPVREYGPTTIAPRLENPEGALLRTIEIQHRNKTKKPIDERNRLLWAGGVPRP
eukprot:7754704-Alexandrium_andersonii.AAC.1